MDSIVNSSAAAAPGFRISAEAAGSVNFASRQNGVPVLRSVTVENLTGTTAENILLRVYSPSDTVIPFERELPPIPAGEAIVLRASDTGALSSAVEIDAEALAALTERLRTTLIIALYIQGRPDSLCEERYPLILLAYDEWQGFGCYPELLSSFVLPNSPSLAPVLAKTAELLGKWSDSPALDGYQSKSPDRVRRQAAALYGALQLQNIVYSVPPASFEEAGQRIRLCDNVLARKMGTCLDLTLLYVSCLEAMGLHPVIVVQKGHAFAGVWLEEMTFSETVTDDASALTKRMADGVSELVTVECTAMTAGMSMNFESAVRLSAEKLTGINPVECIIDVRRARLSGIRPLPSREKDETGTIRIKTDIQAAVPEAPASVVKSEVSLPADAKNIKKDIWERGLLDLSLRNSLINIRLNGNTLPFLTPTSSELEDALSDGDEFTLAPLPSELTGKAKRDSFETVFSSGNADSLISEEFKNKRLRTVCSETELARLTLNLYRLSKTALEENGANTLYLACGFLRWFETSASKRPRYAPLILIPVELIRKSAKRGFVLRLRDDEPQINITLLEMLRRDFGIDIKGLDPLPTDEKGIDMKAAYSAVRQAVMSMSGWDVLDGVCMGIFSFSRFVMWNDLRNRSEQLALSPIVKSLMDGVTFIPEKSELNAEKPDIASLLTPLPCDASQLRAVAAAAAGESFVLHGPPGTGKSQTITSIIANMLAEGKTVLFVAEKMAALSVVEKRLDKLGIGAFCLELHSNKSKKHDLLEQLRQATEAATSASPSEYEKQAAAAAALRKELDEYSSALHSKGENGMSLFEMIDSYEKERNSPDGVVFDGKSAVGFTEEQRASLFVIAERLAAAGKNAGQPHNNPLRSVRAAEYRQQLRLDLPSVASAYAATVEPLKSAADALSASVTALGFELAPAVTEADYLKYSRIADELYKWSTLPVSWAKAADIDALCDGVCRLSSLTQAASAAATALSSSWKPELLALDGEAYGKRYNEALKKWFIPRFFALNAIKKELAPYSLTRINSKALAFAVPLLEERSRNLTAAAPLAESYGSYAEAYTTNGTVSQEAVNCCETARSSAASLKEITGSDGIRLSAAAEPGCAEAVSAYRSAYAVHKEKQQSLNALVDTDFTLYGDDYAAAQTAIAADLSSSAEGLKEWMAYVAVRNEARNAGLSPLITAYEDGLADEELLPALRKGLYGAAVVYTVENTPALSHFSGAVYSEKIAQLKRVDDELRKTCEREIYFRLAAKVPDFTREASNASELGILQRAIRSNGRGVSIRRLFEQIPNLLPRLCPCMLMSPLSAAQYLNPDRAPFDAVVFDEASQIQTCKAVGALARGKSAIIVGDPKQMPPTTFFMSMSDSDENPEAEDLESILDDALAIGIPQSHLVWHYRSRHESLIAFSNSEFYENRLCTFPSVNDRETRVRLVRVDGCFDRGGSRRNVKEAEAVVAELIRRSSDPELSKLSVGIVTFNIAQQNLIDDLLEDACRKDASLEKWIYGSEEPLFIKNLENVQGDERDSIIISVGYGTDKNGKMHMNFGPLNKEGGWRRLNVAVTRARCELTVFSSVTSDMIDMTRTGSRGVAALRDFLSYAEKGRLQASVASASGISSDGLLGAVSDVLKAAGYKTDTCIGRSRYRVDIGVEDPELPGSYLCGIITDGGSSRTAETTEEREISQHAVLEGLGWTLFRVWSVDWWENPEKEAALLLARVNGLKAERDKEKLAAVKTAVKKTVSETAEEPCPPEPAPSDTENQTVSESRVSEDIGAVETEAAPEVTPLITSGNATAATAQPQPAQTSRLREYKVAVLPLQPMSADDFLSSAFTSKISAAFRSVLKAEAPISEPLLVKRVLKSFGLTKTGTKIPAKCSEILQRLKLVTTEQNGTVFYWYDASPADCDYYRVSEDVENRREPADLPKEEAAAAVLEILTEQIGLPEQDLIREASRRLGYTRSGNVVSAAVERGIALAEAEERINISKERYISLA